MFERAPLSTDLHCRRPYELDVGNFAGDERSDISCRSKAPLPVDWTIRLPSTRSDYPGDSQVHLLGLCMVADAEMHVADMDGDGRDDFVCHRRSTGDIAIEYQKPRP